MSKGGFKRLDPETPGVEQCMADAMAQVDRMLTGKTPEQKAAILHKMTDHSRSEFFSSRQDSEDHMGRVELAPWPFSSFMTLRESTNASIEQHSDLGIREQHRDQCRAAARGNTR